MTAAGPAPRAVGNVFWFAKDERRPADWEDGAAFDLARGRLAVADGASAAYRAREWAGRLVEAYVEAPPRPGADPEAVRSWFGAAAEAWTAAETGSEPVEWYHQDAAHRGSFAAFVGAQLAASGSELAWSAVAVGDCCLLQVRGDRLVTAFPLTDPAQFGSAPMLVPSAADKLPLLRDRVHTAAGTARPGDLILLSSDALAKFMLTSGPRDAGIWPALRSITGNQEFADLIRYLRAQNALDIDDVTLLRILVTT